jgi:choline dehydrogenase-like flavoprotein
VTVLVLEAGVRLVRILAFHAGPYPLSTHSDQGVLAAEAPFLGPTLTPSKPTNIRNMCYEIISIFLGTPYDWNYTVAAQTGLNGRTFPYPRGRLLGGSSSASACFIANELRGRVS